MNEIIPGLWLGSYPTKETIPNLLRVGVKYILTADMVPLTESVFAKFIRKFIYLCDVPSQDILDILEEALDFIQTSLDTGAPVLVHCSMGISRSATLVIAYLMRSGHMSYNDALEHVMKKRLVYPNIGFVNQLKFFEVMRWIVNVKSPVYMQYAATRKYHRGSNSIHHTDPTDGCPAILNYNSSSLELPSSYKCRLCGRGLFSSANLITHSVPVEKNCQPTCTLTDPGDIPVDTCVNTVLIKGISLNDTLMPCTMAELFTEPLEWTRRYTHEVEGKLYCPGCQAKVGSFNWCGEPCVCGTWVTPAFHFNRNHIDQITRRPHMISTPEMHRTIMQTTEHSNTLD